jgi:hypothetical protein
MNIQTRLSSSAPQPTAADAIIAEVPLVVSEKPKYAAQELPKDCPPHHHPAGVCDKVVGLDSISGLPIIREVAARKPMYIPTCKACQWEDRDRLATEPELLDLSSVLFLVPEVEYDQRICKLHVSKRYPDAKAIASSFHAERLTFVPNARIVVVTRRPPMGSTVGPRYKRRMDEEGVWQEWELEPATYLSDVVESAPIVVAECMRIESGSMFADQKHDLSELVARLSEVAQPYRIAIPAHPDDRMYIMRSNS